MGKRPSINMKSKDRPFELCDIVRETAFAIHRYHGPGHLRKNLRKRACAPLA
jgi:hypothetical protein